jgi:hypothetical protein
MRRREFITLLGGRLPQLMADLVRRKVAVIATPGAVTTVAAKASTATIPIVFGVGDGPIRLGLVDSVAQPGGNATAMAFRPEAIAFWAALAGRNRAGIHPSRAPTIIFLAPVIAQHRRGSLLAEWPGWMHSAPASLPQPLPRDP